MAMFIVPFILFGSMSVQRAFCHSGVAYSTLSSIVIVDGR